ncbi:nitrite reductase small subunit NirD [Pseudobacteriovorax antillogorgiicola]|uniref:Assimilatory nitrite reductase (NAD(P)H) small subunit n=1 Tax=Pseudobacteriovorax antillogorgiicola TaxID=1513793 RepID=A0A1Y6C0F1_9BACT|nr:nitrite reductase small subunit NirD [Pseudobacteriovorax antillogorgiicola]TCS52328.1 assimilatory nitrite reductase (NAD(P)H) small subunit [Pseudobacteriovorax antillogorgiicola]SMF29967.1 assimilatory nitrite reductase (NAD(P)H) small subunit [Pseudobacteriovorax antillogorgiicola]
MTMKYLKVASLDDIPRQGGRGFLCGAYSIALVRTIDDQLFAIENSCPHRKGPLADGIVHGTKVTCPLHNWVFDLKNGHAEFPDEGQVKCFPIKIEHNDIYVRVEI